MIGKKPQILIIDDDPQLLETLSLLLEEDYDVICAASGVIALELFAQHRPAAIICDLMMPQMSGIDVYHQLKTRFAGAENAMIFITGGACSEEAIHFLQTIPNARLEKPFRSKVLKPLIEAILV